ncbi:lytic transglycosylase domain-containing protein [Serratia ureilytica]|uniref:lytic transglycosylase domain-containing protein n=1 Tax=Serratia ureilytica TaxID=300181 RepID=UPI001AA19EDA|nr:lytic transglycosylase domain-containing protein [Serratia ureilytica]MBO1811555.1 lytic transglycosylase domain-containing protein [Serratia ureilytica]
MRTVLLLMICLLPQQAGAWCFREAGARYGVDPLVLQAIAIWESRMRADVVGYNKADDGRILSRDYGVMQVNSANVARLQRIGVIRTPQDLLDDACLNVQAGAWVLARHLRVCGNTWGCLGSYNAGFADTRRQERRRMAYAAEIHAIYTRLKAREADKVRLAIR